MENQKRGPPPPMKLVIEVRRFFPDSSFEMIFVESSTTTGAGWPHLPTDCRNRRNLVGASPLPLALSFSVAAGCSSPTAERMSSQRPEHIATLLSLRWEDS